MRCCRAVVIVLLRAGFPVSALTPAGTALHEAALCGKLEVVRCLLERGVALDARDQAGLTVLEVLAQFPAHLTHEMSALITRHSECKQACMHVSHELDSSRSGVTTSYVCVCVYVSQSIARRRTPHFPRQPRGLRTTRRTQSLCPPSLHQGALTRTSG